MEDEKRKEKESSFLWPFVSWLDRNARATWCSSSSSSTLPSCRNLISPDSLLPFLQSLRIHSLALSPESNWIIETDDWIRDPSLLRRPLARITNFWTEGKKRRIFSLVDFIRYLKGRGGWSRLNTVRPLFRLVRRIARKGATCNTVHY